MPNSLKFSFPQIVHRLVFELIENEISYSTPCIIWVCFSFSNILVGHFYFDFSFFLSILIWVLQSLNEIRVKGVKVFLGLLSFLKSLSIFLSVNLILWLLGFGQGLKKCLFFELGFAQFE